MSVYVTCVCYVYHVTVYVYVYTHVIMCTTSSCFDTFIFMCYLNRGSLARREITRRVSIGRKRSQSIATKSRPDWYIAKLKCLLRITTIIYYCWTWYFMETSVLDATSRDRHSPSRVSRRAISLREVLSKDYHERTRESLVPDAFELGTSGSRLLKRWESREEGESINYLKQKIYIYL